MHPIDKAGCALAIFALVILALALGFLALTASGGGR